MSTPRVEGFGELVEVGRGGFGTVYRARELDLDRDVAIKVLHHVGAGSDQVELFMAEARAMAQLDHPAIVRVHRTGFTEDGAAFLAMEYLAGGSLADQLKAGPLSEELAISVISSVADGVGAVHAAGLVHRDIKPQNILLNSRGEAKLGDFGIAAEAATSTATQSRELIASLNHAAPELLAGRTARPASDVYSLASTLYQLMTGAAPFAGNGDNLYSVMRRVMEDDPIQPAEASDRTWAAISLGLSKDPDARPSSAAEFVRMLHGGDVAGVVPLATVPMASGETTIVPPLLPPKPPAAAAGSSGPGTARIVAAVALLFVIAGAIFLVPRLGSDPDDTESTETLSAGSSEVASETAAPDGEDIVTPGGDATPNGANAGDAGDGEDADLAGDLGEDEPGSSEDGASGGSEPPGSADADQSPPPTGSEDQDTVSQGPTTSTTTTSTSTTTTTTTTTEPPAAFDNGTPSDPTQPGTTEASPVTSTTEPTPVAATSMNYAGHQTSVAFSWTAPNSDTIGSFRLSYTPNGQTTTVGAGVRSHTFTNIPCGERYTLNITTVSPNGTKTGPTISANFKTFDCPVEEVVAPSTPVGMTAEGVAGGVRVCWSINPSPVEPEDVYLQVGFAAVTLSPYAGCYTMTGLEPGDSKSISLRARINAGTTASVPAHAIATPL